ncbi:MAG: dipeptidase [Eubacteriales bacterium]|jgi:membrane dipeptidase
MRYFDAHCDTMLSLCDTLQDLGENDLHVDLKRTASLEKYSQIFAVWVDDVYRGEEAWQLVRRVSSYALDQLRRQERHMVLCTNWEQYQGAMEAGKGAAVLSLEGAHGLGGRPERIEELYQLGFRLVNLTWNGENELGCGCMAGNGGLKPMGRELLSRMARLGMLADVSHLSERGFWEAAESGCTLIATHSNSRSVWEHPRNLTDEQFQELVRQGTGAGINLYGPFVGGGKDLTQLCRHIERFLELGGEDHLFIGADWDGMDQPAAGLRGIQDMSALYGQLYKLNYNERLLDKIFYGNLEEILRKTLQK